MRFIKEESLLQKENGEENFEKEGEERLQLVAPQAGPWNFQLDYPVAITLTLLNVVGFYGAYLFLTVAKLQTVIFTVIMGVVSLLGVTGGAHRLWSHRAYKARTPLQILLAVFFLLSSQRSIVTWAHDHRLHHKYSDTDGDPHNATRGFFFSTFGWLLVKPHPEVVARKKLIDLNDLLQNPVVKFTDKYIVILLVLIAYILPSYVPTLWGESLKVAAAINILRLTVVVIITGLINSVAHLWGYKPIDRTAVGTQFTFVGVLALGEGFHNFHHVFPYDYRTSEIGDTKYNLTALFINLMAKIGWAYDLKEAPEDVVKARVLKKGDGSDKYYL